MRRILVTGAAGFVGRHALAALAGTLGSSDRLVGIGRGNPDRLPGRAEHVPLDLLDGKALSDLVRDLRPTIVLHLAAVASVQQSADAPTETWRVNVGGLINLAEAVARWASGSHVFFVSSGEVYGRAFLAGRALSEDTEPVPIGSYARSKWFGEEILRDVLPKAGVRLTVLRPFNHIGPGQDERFVVPSFAGQIARIEAGLVPPVLEVGNLAARRDFLAVADVVAAYAGLIDASGRLDDAAIFNVGSGRPRSIASILDDLRAMALVPFEVRIVPDRMRPSEIPLAAGDAARLRAAIGWEPRADWTSALSEILAEARARVARAG